MRIKMCARDMMALMAGGAMLSGASPPVQEFSEGGEDALDWQLQSPQRASPGTELLPTASRIACPHQPDPPASPWNMKMRPFLSIPVSLPASTQRVGRARMKIGSGGSRAGDQSRLFRPGHGNDLCCKPPPWQLQGGVCPRRDSVAEPQKREIE